MYNIYCDSPRILSFFFVAEFMRIPYFNVYVLCTDVLRSAWRYQKWMKVTQY